MEYPQYYAQDVYNLDGRDIVWLVHPNPLPIPRLCALLAASTFSSSLQHIPHIDIHNLLSSARIIAGENTEVFLRCRGSSNPYECLGKGPFINRSAMKLVNLDAIFDLLSPNTSSFVDICGGPGGFTEYILKRHSSTSSMCVGFGITLKHPQAHSCNWHLHQLNMPPMISIREEDEKDPVVSECEFIVTYGADASGNILHSSNVQHFIHLTHQRTPSVSLVVADGGTLEGRDCEAQGSQGYALLIHQIAAALGVLGSNGDAVFKVFGLHEACSQFSIGVLTHLFHRVCVIKPICSRASSGEVYVVCKEFRSAIQGRDDLIEACMRSANRSFFPISQLLTDDMMKIMDIFDLSLRVHQIWAFHNIFSQMMQAREVENITIECIKEWMMKSTTINLPSLTSSESKRHCCRKRIIDVILEMNERHYSFRNMRQKYLAMWKLDQLDFINDLLASNQALVSHGTTRLCSDH